MMFFEIDNLSIVSVLRPNGSFGYYGGCNQHIRPMTWGDTGTIETQKLVNSASCSWSVDTFQNINRIRESEDGQKFHDVALKENKLCAAIVQYYQPDLIAISIFVKQNLFSSFESLVEKCWFNDNLKITIRVDGFVGFRTKGSNTITPTLEDFIDKRAALTVDDISFIMRKFIL